MENHPYIKLLDYAVKHNRSYHMEPGLHDANMSESDFEVIRDSLFENANTVNPPPNKNRDFGWLLKPEALFGYLNYKQYEHAQKSAQRAMYFASASLLVSVVTLVVAIYSM